MGRHSRSRASQSGPRMVCRHRGLRLGASVRASRESESRLRGRGAWPPPARRRARDPTLHIPPLRIVRARRNRLGRARGTSRTRRRRGSTRRRRRARGETVVRLGPVRVMATARAASRSAASTSPRARLAALRLAWSARSSGAPAMACVYRRAASRWRPEAKARLPARRDWSTACATSAEKSVSVAPDSASIAAESSGGGPTRAVNRAGGGTRARRSPWRRLGRDEKRSDSNGIGRRRDTDDELKTGDRVRARARKTLVRDVRSRRARRRVARPPAASRDDEDETPATSRGRRAVARIVLVAAFRGGQSAVEKR